MHSFMAEAMKLIRCCSQGMDLIARENCDINIESCITRVADRVVVYL